MTNWAHWGLCKIKLWWPNGQLQSNPRYLWPLRHVTRLSDDLAWLTKQLCLLIHVHEYLNFQIDSMIGIFYVFSWMHIYRLLNFKSYRFNGQAIYIGLTNSHRIRNKCFFLLLEFDTLSFFFCLKEVMFPAKWLGSLIDDGISIPKCHILEDYRHTHFNDERRHFFSIFYVKCSFHFPYEFL